MAHRLTDYVKENRISKQTIQKRVTEVSGIKACVAAIKKELPPRIMGERVEWNKVQLEIRPHGKD